MQCEYFIKTYIQPELIHIILHLAMRMASYIGRVGEFSHEKETLGAYVEQMEVLFMANNIVETPSSEHVAANQCVAEQKRATERNWRHDNETQTCQFSD